MKNAHLFIILVFSSLLIFSCSKDDNEETFTEQYSFTIDGTDYDYSEFEVSTTWLEDQNRIFISKEDGNEEYNINFPLDLNIGANGMDWNGGGLFFFMRTPKGDFFTLDEATSTMNVIEIDTINRRVSATFEGIGTQGLGNEFVTFSNGVIKAKY